MPRTIRISLQETMAKADSASCPACDNPSDACVCYEGLSRPDIRLTDDGAAELVFKKDWSQEDSENFADDFRERLGARHFEAMARKSVLGRIHRIATLRKK
jgi:hypothetical protein